MERAVLLIGVSKTGGLPELQAVGSGIGAMQQWATAQGITGNRLVTLTDTAGGSVRAHQVADAIEALLAPRQLQKLVVYFAGHGIHNGGDYWLLSGAPARSEEAINVESSIQLARYCGLEHVVLLSDACRTAAGDIQAQGVTGISAFPNDPVDGEERAVDAFFACARGKPALEVRDVAESAGAFSALYTEVLTECLSGRDRSILAADRIDGADVALLRAWKLSDKLEAALPPRLKAKLGKIPTINQLPTSRITSRDDWLSVLPMAALQPPPMAAAAGPSRGRGRGGGIAGIAAPTAPAVAAAGAAMLSVGNVGARVVADVVNLNSAGLSLWADNPFAAPGGGSAEARLVHQMAGEFGHTFGPVAFESQCGFKLRGAQLAQVVCRDARVEMLGDDGEIARLWPHNNRRCNALLVLRDGGSVLLPVLPGFIAALSFDGPELAQVSYEPSHNSPRWNALQTEQQMLNTLRASVAAAANLGVFRLRGPDAPGLARALQLAKAIDPTLALYAAYAYHELRDKAHLAQMNGYLAADLGALLFDVALLADAPALRKALAAPLEERRVLPPLPLLSQGWPLLPAFDVTLPRALQGVERCLRPSLWTVFDETGTWQLLNAFENGELR